MHPIVVWGMRPVPSGPVSALRIGLYHHTGNRLLSMDRLRSVVWVEHVMQTAHMRP